MKKYIIMLSILTLSQIKLDGFYGGREALKTQHKEAQYFKKKSQRQQQQFQPDTAQYQTTNQTSASTELAESINVKFFYSKSTIPTSYSTRLQDIDFSFGRSFTQAQLQEGLSLDIALFPPSTKSSQTYIVVLLLKSQDGSIVKQLSTKVKSTYPPTFVELFYNDQPLPNKSTLFKVNNNLSTKDNLQIFNQFSPVIKKYIIKMTDEGIIYKEG